MKTSIVITYYYTGEESIDMTVRCLDSLKYGMPNETRYLERW